MKTTHPRLAPVFLKRCWYSVKGSRASVGLKVMVSPPPNALVRLEVGEVNTVFGKGGSRDGPSEVVSYSVR